MNYIQNSSICQPTFINKAIAGITCVLTVTSIVLFIIGLTAPQGGPFNVISQLGSNHNGILLGTSIFLFILELVWMGAIKKNMIVPAEHLFKSRISKPIDQLILSFLSAKSLSVVCSVNKAWKKGAQDPRLWNAFDLHHYCPKLTIFWGELWENEFASMGLSARDIKPIDGNDKRALIRVLNVFSTQIDRDYITSVKKEPENYDRHYTAKRADDGITILTIPKGLTFNKLVTFSETLTSKYGPIFGFIDDKFRERYGNETVNETYRVVLTNTVLKKTCDLSIEAQMKTVKELGIGCDFPKVIEMVTLLIAKLITSNTHLFTEKDSAQFARCEEAIDGAQLRVGFFKVGFGLIIDDFCKPVEHNGVAGRWKLHTIEA